MKIGLLTFHSQLNYGGVLQCWALRRILLSLGHRVVVLDRWLDDENASLWNLWPRSLSAWIKWTVKAGLGWLAFGHLVRIWRTARFVRGFGLTPYHFVDWSDAPRDLGVDAVVVGSDQVWNPTLDYTRAYLMERAPAVRRLAYAASFGVPALASAQAAGYASALRSFSAVSCREREGVAICRQLGVEAEHVVDPTQLIDADVWRKMAGVSVNRRSRRGRTVIYLLAESVPDVLTFLADRADNASVVLVNSGDIWPKTLGWRDVLRRHRLNGRVRYGCGPREFVRFMAEADRIVTDSFHALMFASIFGTDIRFVCPTKGGWRSPMFARIREFADAFVRGPLFANGLGPALDSFQRGERVTFDEERLREARRRSMVWLAEHVRAS